MSNEYFSSIVMNQAIDMVTKGLRDLRSTDLEPFFSQEQALPKGYVGENYGDVQQTMMDSGLPAVTRAAFSSQLSNADSRQLFIDFLGDGGLVQTETGDDFVEADHADSLPDLGSVGDLLVRLAEEGVVTLDIERARTVAALVNLPRPPTVMHHLRIPGPDPIGELDPIVAIRFAKMRQYLRSYFSTS